MLYVLMTILFLSVTINLWLVWRVVLPLRRLSNQTVQLAQGDLTALQQPRSESNEIERLRYTMASMAQHVRRTQEEELHYRHSLTEAQEAERRRIARELHDDTIQSLVAIGQSIDLAVKWSVDDQKRSIDLLTAARLQSVSSVEALRRLIANLRPPALEELGIVPALRMLADSEPEAQITLAVEGNQRRLDEEYELTLYRIAQEAIRNAHRHGHAKHVKLDINFQPSEVMLTIKDNGIGFDAKKGLECFALQGRYGLLGIQERVQRLNGKIEISSSPEQGTTIVARLPLQDDVQPTNVVRDPVCGALIHPHQAYGTIEHRGQRHYFCCPVCQGAFQRDPQLYIFDSSAGESVHDTYGTL
jgi:signal transduction histidine kinase/YHS domain-containing protein